MRPNFSEIQPLFSADHDEILTLWENSVRATHHFLQEKEIDFYRPLIKKYALPDFTLFGIRENNNQLCGIIGLKNDKIEMLFVHPAFFRQKIGTRLLNYATKNQKCKKVDVNEENPNALHFYENYGFKIFSRSEKDERGKPHPILHLCL